MDIAYDHIIDDSLPTSEDGRTTPTPSDNTQKSGSSHRRQESLSTEFNQAYRAISSSPWGMRFGAIFEQVKKQGEVYYDATKHEYEARSEQAAKGLTELKEQIATRSRALSTEGVVGDSDTNDAGEEGSSSGGKTGGKSRGWISTVNEDGTAKSAAQLIKEQNIIKDLRAKAMKGITDLQKAEDAADEYLLKLGTNLGNFFKDAVTIAPPEDGEDEIEGRARPSEKEVLFETKGSEESKRPIHTTRLDAQLHLLHTNLDNFKSDPRSSQYTEEWVKTFSAEKRTEQISKDLEQYPELRSSMEKLVPDSVQYEEFWKRYYFLRSEIEGEEQKRKDLLKAAAKDDEEVGWDEEESADEAEVKAKPSTKEKVDNENEEDDEEDDEEEDDEDDDEDEDEESDDSEDEDGSDKKKSTSDKATVSTTTNRLKPKSTDVTSQPDSEASYDVVSGAPSGAPSNSGGSPPKSKPKEESDEEEDWE